MTRMSRRSFMAFTGALAASMGLPRQMLAPALAAPTQPADVPTTLRETIRQSTTGNKAYRTLRTAAGEPFIARTDLMTKRTCRGPGGSATIPRVLRAHLRHPRAGHPIAVQAGADERLQPDLVPGHAGRSRRCHCSSRPRWCRPQRCRLQPGDGCPMAAVLNTGTLPIRSPTSRPVGTSGSWTGSR